MKKAFAEGKSLFRTEARKIFLDKKAMVLYNILCVNRDVAQFGRALRSGRRSRRFKSCHPDQIKKSYTNGMRLFYLCMDKKEGFERVVGKNTRRKFCRRF